MSDPIFFRRAGTPTLADIIALTGASARAGADLSTCITGVAPLDAGAPGDIVFLDNPKYTPALATTRASACLLTSRYADQVPSNVIALISPDPYRAFAKVLTLLYPEAARPASLFGSQGVSPGAYVHPDARLEAGVVVDPGAVIGPGASIGAGSVIGPHAVIGPDVRVGRNASIGAHASVTNALVGDRVILHPGVRIGQDGFGFAMGPKGHMKIPQIGRVIIQNDVEIGANSCVDRGATRDTIIGEGTKIDNQVQIGHNVTIGRHCVIVSQVGISGSTEIGDFVAIGGQAGLAGHLRIGAGAKIAATAGVMRDVPAGETWGGAPAMPTRQFFKRHAEIDRLIAGAARKTDDGSGGGSSTPDTQT